MNSYIINPVDPELIKAELSPKFFLRKTNKGGNEIYVFKGDDAPNTMLEVGRLREEAFSYYGGGTGLPADIDEFDRGENAYFQLVVWNPEEKSILGGYRFIYGSKVSYPHGIPKLATAEMFHFSEEFLKDYLPYTIELGRSFVSLAYQSTRKDSKSMFALDNLWDGIGALSVLTPNMKYFYGKVTMYKDYNKKARNLILYFLDKHFHDHKGLIIPKEPLPIELTEDEKADLFPYDNFKDNYRILSKKVRSMGINIPPLFNAYMSLSPEMLVFGTAINHHFGEVEETGILIAVDKILENKLDRHMHSFSIDQEEQKRLWNLILTKEN